MRLRNAIALLFLLGGFATPVAKAVAQDAVHYPARPVHFVVPLSPGGGVDTLARTIAEALQAKWGQPVVIDNRAGAGGNIGANVVYKAQPDGYTLLFTAGGLLVNNRYLYEKLTFDPDAFAPVSIVANSGSVLVVHPSVPAKSVAELIALAKAQPDLLDYASPGAGTGSHLTAELFKAMAGVRLTHVPYKGTSPALADVLAGRVGIMFGETGSVLPHIQVGSLRALAVTSAHRDPSLPDVPTVGETVPGFVATPWNGVVAPPRTPAPIAEKIAMAIADVMKAPDVEKRLTQRNFQIVGGGPAELQRLLKDEDARWSVVIRNLKAQGGLAASN